MAYYLLPHDFNMTIEDKKLLFSLKNRMFQLSNDFNIDKNNKQLCVMKCGSEENLEHIYNCLKINIQSKNKESYNLLYNGTLIIQDKIFKIIKEKITIRQRIIENNNL